MAKSFVQRRWKLLLNIATIVALVLFVFLIREQLVETWQNLERVHWWALLLIIPLEIWNYDAQARLYRSLFHIVGNKFSYRQMYETALELNLINNVFPSGGVSGISYFGVRLKSEHVTAGRATLVQIMKYLLLFLSFEILLGFGLLFLAIEGQINSLLLMITAVLSTLLVVGTALFVYIMMRKSRVKVFHRFVENMVNVSARRFKPSAVANGPIRLDRLGFLFDELHHNFKIIMKDYKQLKMPLLFAMIANLTEIFVIYAVYVAFGEWVNLGAVILAYSVANFAGLVSVLPGGVGIYEALMTTVLVAAGIPVALSLPVTIMYRVLSSAIQLPPGYYLYHKALRNGTAVKPQHG